MGWLGNADVGVGETGRAWNRLDSINGARRARSCFRGTITRRRILARIRAGPLESINTPGPTPQEYSACDESHVVLNHIPDRLLSAWRPTGAQAGSERSRHASCGACSHRHGTAEAPAARADTPSGECRANVAPGARRAGPHQVARSPTATCVYNSSRALAPRVARLACRGVFPCRHRRQSVLCGGARHTVAAFELGS